MAVIEVELKMAGRELSLCGSRIVSKRVQSGFLATKYEVA